MRGRPDGQFHTIAFHEQWSEQSEAKVHYAILSVAPLKGVEALTAGGSR
ncbi:hypothetical protein Lesp02_64970 [Lentzea sp. NBRC 105346]|nr:hypothetical protein Lesp02_64970 [Lentzea sp. NBRC 105346]